MNYNEKTEIVNLPYRPNDNIGFSDIIQYAKKEKPNYTPNPNKRKGSERRRPSGERERNVGHPDGEELACCHLYYLRFGGQFPGI